jgi:hypothetical protein
MTKQPADRFGWLFTRQDIHRDPNPMPNIEGSGAPSTPRGRWGREKAHRH